MFLLYLYIFCKGRDILKMKPHIQVNNFKLYSFFTCNFAHYRQHLQEILK